MFESFLPYVKLDLYTYLEREESPQTVFKASK